jgi:hypothetical protein
MNARGLRRLFLSVGMAAIVSASVYAATGTSSAAGSPRPSGVSAVRTVPVKFDIVNKAGQTIRRGTGVAKVVRLGSAAAKRAGAPKAVEGPSTYCYAYFHYSASVGAGSYYAVEILFSSGPFVVGSSFNQTTRVFYAEQTEYQSGDDVWVSVLNNGSSTETLAGYYAALYTGGGC